jgi:hypothetical protein
MKVSRIVKLADGGAVATHRYRHLRAEAKRFVARDIDGACDIKNPPALSDLAPPDASRTCWRGRPAAICYRRAPWQAAQSHWIRSPPTSPSWPSLARAVIGQAGITWMR